MKTVGWDCLVVAECVGKPVTTTETDIPQHIVERIINLLDIEKKVEMYESGVLKEMTTDARIIEQWEVEVFKHYKDRHRNKLRVVLSSLPFHVWDDGTPIKKFKARKCMHPK